MEASNTWRETNKWKFFDKYLPDAAAYTLLCSWEHLSTPVFGLKQLRLGAKLPEAGEGRRSHCSSAAAFSVLVKLVQAWQLGASQRLSGGSLAGLPLIKAVSNFQWNSRPRMFCIQSPSSPDCRTAQPHRGTACLWRGRTLPPHFTLLGRAV